MMVGEIGGKDRFWYEHMRCDLLAGEWYTRLVKEKTGILVLLVPVWHTEILWDPPRNGATLNILCDILWNGFKMMQEMIHSTLSCVC